eukprot:1398073-Rhodomonas_salina.1
MMHHQSHGAHSFPTVPGTPTGTCAVPTHTKINTYLRPRLVHIAVKRLGQFQVQSLFLLEALPPWSS